MYDITDEMLYAHVPVVERLELSKLPAEDSLQHEFSKRFLRKMRRIIREQRRTKAQQKAVRYTKRSLAALVVAIALLMAMVMSVSALRAKFFEVIREWFPRYTEVSFTTENSAVYSDPEYKELQPKQPTYLPEGFVEENYDYMEGSPLYITYTNGEQIIDYTQTPITAYRANIDTEDAEQKIIQTDTQEYWLVLKEDIYYLQWNDDTQVYEFITNTRYTMSEEELIKIAESVK